MESLTTSVHYGRHIDVASGMGAATSPTVAVMAIQEPPRRPWLVVLDAVARHPGTALVVTVVLWALDHFLG